MEKTTLIALVLFIINYVLMIAIPKKRVYVVMTTAILMVILGLLPVKNVLEEIDFNVIMMIAGTMGIVALFIQSKMPELLSDIIIDKMPNLKWVILALSLFAGFISAFVDNVATVLMIVPVAIEVSKKLNVSPVKMVIAISVASNLQGAATLVGDTTSILLGSYADMNFMDFIFYNGKMGLFFIVQISMIVATGVLYYIFRKDNEKVTSQEKTVVRDYFPTFLLVGVIVLLIIASLVNIPEIKFLPDTERNISGYICMGMLLLGFIVQGFRFGFPNAARVIWKDIDFNTLALLTGLFVVIGGIKAQGVIDIISNLFLKVGSSSVFAMYTFITFISVIFSAFIDNIPYVATMLPVVTLIASKLQVDPTVLYFGLLSGATLGGNLTPIGASANITSMGILYREGYEDLNKTFMKISVPYTLSAVFTGYILIWLIFGM